ncbi:type III secretion system export apparatus subunit SctT [Paucibacter sp. PLA-PC-4]|uniref:type III secretion system export apparatus subunit SctT n=1 Tax=Paucibacter sp. PLA-PC-4 TaxID=2993655 RepID=UPI00224AD00C|nr:type III secretion system export apparatus subunit SctT [Paucibacter sp. PLA-PC-4]MCX2865590.1 type III secretion system export apparatus subunit SctT [Paucibacter sp. PLA-PC-4]
MNPEDDVVQLLLNTFGPAQDMFMATALASLRVQIAFSLLPPTSTQFIQGFVRSGLVVMIGGFIAFGAPPGELSGLTPLAMTGIVIKEVLIGLVIGFMASSVFWIAQSVGTLIDQQAGYGGAQMSSPVSQEQVTPVASLLLMLLVGVFYQLGGLLVFLGALFESFQLWPLTSSLPSVTAAADLFVIDQGASLMRGIVQFATPVLLVLVLIELGFGFLTRAADKLEPGGLAQPVKSAVTLLLLALLVGVLLTHVRRFLLPTDLLVQLRAAIGLP